MTDKPENQVMADTQPAYDPPQALRMGDIHAGAGGTGCVQGSAVMVISGCRDGIGADGDCSTGDGANPLCTSTGNTPAVTGD
jgi:hypothetical protein